MGGSIWVKRAATFSMVQSDSITAVCSHYIIVPRPICEHAWYVLPWDFLLIPCDNVCFFSPLRESHSEWLLSRTIISVTSLLTFLSTPRVLLWKSDAYIAPHSSLIMEVQGLAQWGRAWRWHHAAPWTAVRMSQVNVGRLKVAVFLMSGNKILLQWGSFQFSQRQSMSNCFDRKL